MTDERPQATPRVDAWWRGLLGRLTPEQRADLFAGRLFVEVVDRVKVGDEGDVVEVLRRDVLRPPVWLEVEAGLEG
jgi:hypothetical protein